RRMARVSGWMRVPRDAQYRAAVCGGVPGESVFARDAASPEWAVLYLHGGGYCVGSAASHRAITRDLAVRGGARVFAADYRLAPEAPFPAAIEDAVAAWRGLLAEGFPPGQSVIAGDSAGGGLAVAAALRLREIGLPMPAALVLFSPWVDLALDGLGEPQRGEVTLSRPWLAACADAYLGEAPAGDPLASPVRADLRGLPPTLIQAGADELLLADARRLSEAMSAAGVDVELQVHEGFWHVFQLHAGMLEEADRALAATTAFIASRAPLRTPVP
ncbi:MAG: alpha/beta hydrolase, partial [Chloroflexi bacterium]|nr:alpha/beta hydrolase [Chloroflexota bacterium]